MYNIFTLHSLSSNLFILLLGFVSGNLFPTFCGEFLGKAYILILISLESFNFFYYSHRKGVSPRSQIQSREKIRAPKAKSPPAKFYELCPNSLKIGFLFGLFVDAFKVGS
jgi:hypothetical protein